MKTILISLLAGTCFHLFGAGQSWELDPGQFHLNTLPFSAERVSMTAHGQIVIQDVWRFYILDPPGRAEEAQSIREIRFSEIVAEALGLDQMPVSNLNFIPQLGLYAVNSLKPGVARLVFVDEEGHFIGQAFDPNQADPFDLYFRQILVVGDRCFASFWQQDETLDSQSRHLLEISFRETTEGFELEYHLPKVLSRFDDADSLTGMFNQMWLASIQGRYYLSDQVFPLEEKAPPIWIYSRDQRGMYREGGYFNLDLPGFVKKPPKSYEALRAHEPELGRQALLEAWLYSFSRATSLQDFQGNLLISYEVPNPSWQPGISSSDDIKKSQHPFLLTLLLTDRDGRPLVKAPVSLPGAFMAGVHPFNGQIYTFHLSRDSGPQRFQIRWQEDPF